MSGTVVVFVICINVLCDKKKKKKKVISVASQTYGRAAFVIML